MPNLCRAPKFLPGPHTLPQARQRGPALRDTMERRATLEVRIRRQGLRAVAQQQLRGLREPRDGVGEVTS